MSSTHVQSTSKNKAKTDIRLDIQALRAVAVLGVLIYHINPAWLSGGLIGVDVFFVLSGYLISAHLISELQKKGQIDFSSFWARRVKRLLPASLTVLAVSLVGVLLLIPDSLKNVFYRDITAATFYAANWVFAGDSSDYFAADNAASPVLHFWSLGVEEQFYLFWPLLLVGGWFLLGKLMPRALAMSTAVLLFSIPSLFLAIAMVLDKDPSAYYVTTTRVWEFGVGALVAILLSGEFARKISESSGLRILTALGWFAGFVAIFAYMAFFKTEYGFPGLNAIIPVLATALVLIGKPSDILTFGDRFAGLRPIQYTGAISYSIYLWHWVLLVFTPYLLVKLEPEFATGGLFASTPEVISDALRIDGTAISDLTLIHIGLIVFLTFLFAGLTTKYIENPVRFSPIFKAMPNWVVFVAMLAAMFALAGAAKVASDYNTSQLQIQAVADANAEAELAKIVDSEEGSNIADLALGEVATEDAQNSADGESSTLAEGSAPIAEPTESGAAVDEPEEQSNSGEFSSAGSANSGNSGNTSSIVWTQEMCAGPASILVPDCAKFEWANVIPAIGAKEDTAGTIKPVWMDGDYKSCLAFMDNYDPQHCIYGVLDGAKKVALVGDSHAFHWLPAFNTYAKNNDTQLHFFARSGCPLNLTPRDAEKKHMEGCLAWSKGVQDILVSGDYDLVVISNYGNTAFSPKGYASEVEAGKVGYQEAWKPIIRSGAKVIVLKDTPFIGTKAWDCAVANPNNLNKCSVSEKEAFKIMDERIPAAKEMGVPILDMTKYFCRNGTCPIEIGGVRVYRDSNHMTGTYNLLLSPYLTKELARF
jgi:peptidoglycan/LPS O-acetylase OafA/YrhL